MTKLQIVELNAKDRGDLYALLYSHEVADHDDRAIDVARITALTAEDWGLQRTFEINLDRLTVALADAGARRREPRRHRGAHRGARGGDRGGAQEPPLEAAGARRRAQALVRGARRGRPGPGRLSQKPAALQVPARRGGRP